MCTAGTCLLHHVKCVCSHSVVRQFLAKHSIPASPQSFYSPDLSSSGLFLFLELKITLKGRRCQAVENINANATNDLKAKPQTSFKQRFQKWKRRRERCTAAQGDHFEGDNIQ
jgi:hypothetical protein